MNKNLIKLFPIKKLFILMMAILTLLSIFPINIFAEGMDDIEIVGGRYEDIKKSLLKYPGDFRNYNIYNFISYKLLKDWSARVAENERLDARLEASYNIIDYNDYDDDYIIDKYDFLDIDSENFTSWVPSIIMEKDDCNKLYKTYYSDFNYFNLRKKLLGQGDLLGIFQDQYKLIKTMFGDKYNRALKQVFSYIDTLNINNDDDTLSMNSPDNYNITFNYKPVKEILGGRNDDVNNSKDMFKDDKYVTKMFLSTDTCCRWRERIFDNEKARGNKKILSAFNDFLMNDNNYIEWIPSIIMEADDELKFYKIYNGEGEDTLLLNNGDLIEIFNNQDKLIRETFGNKYDEALKQMWEYIDSLNILTTKEGDSLILTMNHPYKKNIQFYYNFSEDFSKDSSSEIDIDDIFIPNDDNDQIIPSSKRPPQ